MPQVPIALSFLEALQLLLLWWFYPVLCLFPPPDCERAGLAHHISAHQHSLVPGLAVTGRGIEGLLTRRGAVMEESAGTSPKGWPGLCGQRLGEPCWEGAQEAGTGTVVVGLGV